MLAIIQLFTVGLFIAFTIEFLLLFIIRNRKSFGLTYRDEYEEKQAFRYWLFVGKELFRVRIY